MTAQEFDRTRRADRRWPLRALLLVLVAALGTGVSACSIGAPSPGPVGEVEEPDGEEVLVEEPSSSVLEPIVLAESPDPEPVPAGFPMDGAEQTGTTADGPCPDLVADGLVFTPNRVRLLGGQTKAAVDIRNCSAGQVGWTASTKPWVTLAAKQATVPSGAVYRLLFTVNTGSLPTGPYAFKIKFNWPGHSASVDVEGVKLGGLVAPGGPPPPTIGGLIAPGPSGCAVKCIVKAWLTPTVGAADVRLEMRTNVSARMWVRVDTQPPQFKAGKPYFDAPDVNLASGTEYRRLWNPTIRPLRPDTTYHIVVVAEDMQKNVSYQVGTFQTRKLATGLANAEPGGCSANCVKTAQLRPMLNSPNFGVEVTTHVPTTMRVLANGDTVASTGGQFRTQWSATLPLEPGTNYDITLKVTDRDGHVQEHRARVSTPKPVAGDGPHLVVRFHEIYVTDDGDSSGANVRGELRFRFEVDGARVLPLDVGEQRVHAPQRLNLGARSIDVPNAPERLTIRVQGLERDNEQPGFCAAGSPVYVATTGHITIDGCYDLEWNTAEIVIDVTAVQQPPAFPACPGLGVQADHCLAVETSGDADPRFSVVLSVDVVD
jgi:hypothetical protein